MRKRKSDRVITTIIFLCIISASIFAGCGVKEKSNDNGSEKKGSKTTTSSEIKDRSELYYVADFDKEESEKIYNKLSEEERQLQINTSKHVGYKNLTSEQIDALKRIKEQGLSGISEFKEMEAIGETNSDERLSVDDIEYIKSLSKEAKSWSEVIDGLEIKQKYPDYRGALQTYTYDAYWLEGNDEGDTLLISHYPTKGDDISSGLKMELIRKDKDEPEILINFNDKPLK